MFRWPIWNACWRWPHDVIAVGPGLGTAPSTVRFVHALVERAGVPLVLDADALNAFAEEPDRLAGTEGRDVIITPHPGEFARLDGGHDGRRAGAPAGPGAQLRDLAPRVRGAQRTPDDHRHTR